MFNNGQPFNGMNGTIMLNTGRDDLLMGTVPGERHGFGGFPLRVRIGLRIERLERRETYQTTEHENIVRPYALAMTSNVWLPNGSDIIAGGATREYLTEVAAHGHPSRFFTPASLMALAVIGDAWHLSDMTAACAHQDVVWEDSEYGRRPSLDLTLPCPHTGYRYGSAWLVRPLPTGVIREVLDLLAGPIGNRNVYVHPDFATEFGADVH